MFTIKNIKSFKNYMLKTKLPFFHLIRGFRAQEPCQRYLGRKKWQIQILCKKMKRLYESQPIRKNIQTGNL